MTKQIDKEPVIVYEFDLPIPSHPSNGGRERRLTGSTTNKKIARAAAEVFIRETLEARQRQRGK